MYPKSLPLVPLIFVFILGVFASYQDELILLWIVLLLSLCCLFYFSLYPPLWWQNLGWGVLFLILGLCVGKNDQHLPRNHYSNLTTLTQESCIQLSVVKKLRATQKNHRYYGNIYQVNGEKAEGKILILLPRKSKIPLVSLGDNLMLFEKLSVIRPPLNPTSFNYKTYLKQLKIYHQLEISTKPILLESTSNIFIKLKRLFRSQLQKTSLSIQAQQLLNTLLLGERNQLNPSTINNYAKAGVVHLFAISGLHVGIMMLLFQWMLSPLKLIPKGPYLHLILTFLLLWGYAFMVGASASVVRSVTLFSAINIGMLSQKKLPTYYYVLLSLGILVFIKPRYILQLGFQMSYLAVFGILFIYPLINIRFKNKFLRYFWNLTALTLAAQLTVAPLSIYHFNQFPGLFLLSNWVLLPFISLFLSVGLGYMILSLISRPPELITSLLNEIIGLLNQFVYWVGNQQFFLFEHLFLDQYTMIFLYAGLIQLGIGVSQKKATWFYLSSLFFVFGIITYQNQLNTQKLWVLHNYGSTLLVEKNKANLIFHSQDTLNSSHYIVSNYRKTVAHKKIQFKPLKNAYRINDQPLIIVDKPWVIDIELPEKSRILLKNNIKINLDRWLKTNNPSLIIIDGSNSAFYINKWKQTLIKHQIPYHITAEKGALLLASKPWSEIF